MRIKTITANVYGEEGIFDAYQYDQTDIPRYQKKFETWRSLRNFCIEDGDRAPNIPESISEVIYCILTGSLRFKSAKKLVDQSFDLFELEVEKTLQMKAAQIKSDLTTFGPKSKWDKLIFMDFYNDGNIDGTIDIYDIPTDLVHKVVVCKHDKKTKEKDITFLHRQETGKRPRFSIKNKIIIPNSIEPMYKKIKLW
jgi:hypothetical protein